MRKLATIRKIDALTPIEGADAIECATIGCEREGVVFKEVNGGMTFKVISNKYLLGEK